VLAEAGLAQPGVRQTPSAAMIRPTGSAA